MNEYKIYLVEDSGAYSQLEIESIDFSTTFSINDLTDISKRKDAISKNLKILGTKNNNRVFGNLFHLNRSVTTGSNLNYNYKSNKKIKSIIYENNIIVMTGDLQVIDVTKNENGDIIYDAIVTGHVVRFFNKIADLELNDLYYPTGTHTYDINTIKNSWTGNTTYIYPSIDYGAYPRYQNNFDFRNFRGGIYLKTYFDAIFKTFGYTYTSTFANSDIFKKCYIPYTEKIFGRNVIGTFFSQTESTQTVTSNIITANRSRYYSKCLRLNAAVTSNIVTVKNNVVHDAEGEAFQSFVLTRASTTDGSITLSFSASGGFGTSFSFQVLPVVNNLVNYQNPIAWSSTPFSTSSGPITGETEVIIPFKEYAENTEFVIVMKNNSRTGQVTVTVNDLNFKLGNPNTKTVVENRINDVLTIQNILPDGIKVYQFLTDVLKMFNLFITSNPDNDRDFIFEDYDRFYSKAVSPTLYSVDWSDKLNNSELTSSFNLNIPKKYNFKFKEDSSNWWLGEYKKKYNENYGDGLINNEEGYSGETTVEVQFSATIVVQSSLDNKIMPNIFSGDPASNKESYKSNFRLLFNNGADECTDYAIGLYTSSGTTLATYSSANDTYNLSSPILKDSNGKDVFNLAFAVPKEVFAPVNQSIFTLPNIYTKFYQSQLLELIDPNFSTFECEIWLNENDISSLNFQTPIYLSTESIGDAYFKLLEVNYKSSLELSKVKLQKILMN
jgi:hypothetical protein